MSRLLSASSIASIRPIGLVTKETMKKMVFLSFLKEFQALKHKHRLAPLSDTSFNDKNYIN